MPDSGETAKQPSLRLAYPVEMFDGLRRQEIPLVAGFLGDFRDVLDVERPPLWERRFSQLTAADVDRILASRMPANTAPRRTDLEALTGQTARIYALDVTKEELADDLQNRIEQSAIFRKFYEEQYGQFGGEPFAFVVVDVPFGRSAVDMAILGRFAEVGAKAACPFITTAAPQMFGVEQWNSLPDPAQLDSLLASFAFAEWRALRDRESAKYLAVAACADALDLTVSLLRACVTGGLGRSEGLISPDASQGALSDEAAATLLRYGYLPATVALSEATTAHRPKRYHQPERSAEAQAVVRLRHVLTTSRFLHAATCLSRDSIGSHEELAGLESALNRWLRDYVGDSPRVESSRDGTPRPLASARFSLRNVIGAPTDLEVVLDCQLNVDGIPSAVWTRHSMLTVNPLPF